MKAQKYIIINENGHYKFKCGYVEFHMHLANEKDYKLIDGGGMFDIDIENKTIKLYGSSVDFGYPRNIEKALKQCYSEIMTDIGDYYYWFSREEVELNMDEFKLIYVDELGKNNEIKKPKL